MTALSPGRHIAPSAPLSPIIHHPKYQPTNYSPFQTPNQPPTHRLISNRVWLGPYSQINMMYDNTIVTCLEVFVHKKLSKQILNL